MSDTLVELVLSQLSALCHGDNEELDAAGSAGTVHRAATAALAIGLARLGETTGGTMVLNDVVLAQDSHWPPDTAGHALSRETLRLLFGEEARRSLVEGIARQIHAAAHDTGKTPNDPERAQAGAALDEVTPFVLGALRQQQMAAGLDANGLARRAVQERAAAEALAPAGLVAAMRESGFLPRVARVPPPSRELPTEFGA